LRFDALVHGVEQETERREQQRPERHEPEPQARQRTGVHSL
jgi:hypothetical protein